MFCQGALSFLRMTGGGEILAAVIEVLTVMIAGTGEGRDQSLATSPTAIQGQLALQTGDQGQVLPAALIMLTSFSSSHRTGLASTEDITDKR